MSALCAILRGTANDPRFQEMLLLRGDLMESVDITCDSHHVRSEDNIHADRLSRGQFDAFRQGAASAGLPPLVPIPSQLLPPDLGQTLDRLVAITLGMSAPDREPEAI